MPQLTLRFRITQDGVVEESVEGIAGMSCHQLTESLEASLGTVQKRELTSEAYLAPNKQNQSISAEII